MGNKNKKTQAIPTLSEYIAQRAEQVRDSAANEILLKDMPEVPAIPAQNDFSKGLAWLGFSDDARIKLAGKDENPLTCIFTTTSQYGDEGAKVPGNITFRDNPEQYGFEPIVMNVDSVRRGDLVQFAPSKKANPIHAAMITGTYKDPNNGDILPTVSYSRGGVGATTQTEEGLMPTMAHDKPWYEIVNKEKYKYPTAYRYVGSQKKKQEWTDEYNNKYGTQRNNGRLGVTSRWADGGNLLSENPWDELSMEQKADVMKLAIEGGVYDLDSIRSGYNEYAKGGKIHIKPENRGKFTALKERTGHSATWFKEHGTPAQKKMAVFALNSRHWKH